MIGPSPYVLINMGARFTPCMHNIKKVIEADGGPVLQWPCPNTTTLTDNKCTLAELCGMGGGVPNQEGITDFKDRSHEPNQWWRFITPIFLHAGIIHIGFNMLLQWTLGRDMEKEIGPLRFALVYFSAGIFGFVLGGNYAPDGITSVGASGSLFGVLALTMLDLLYNWSTRRSPVKDLLFLLLDMAIAFVIGLLPGLDNFSHIGGFLMGIVLGICIIHSPESLRARTGQSEPPYATVDTQPLAHEPVATESKSKITAFAKQPVGFFKGRKPLWWAWWLVRAGGLVAVFIGFILLLRNFYEWRNTCSWCKHLSCLITSNRRLVHLHMPSLRIPPQGGSGVEMIRADLLLYTKEATGHPVEEDAKVISMVDGTFRAMGFAVSHESGGRLEVLEAFGALHACYAVVDENVVVEILADVKVLPITTLTMKQ
ncbi:putative rhomboid protein [Alternaria alternata]|nr:putative rhomboid protein [Alternaria alternata]